MAIKPLGVFSFAMFHEDGQSICFEGAADFHLAHRSLQLLQQIGTEILGKERQALARQFSWRGFHVLNQPVTETVKHTAYVIIARQRVRGHITGAVNLSNTGIQLFQQEK